MEILSITGQSLSLAEIRPALNGPIHVDLASSVRKTIQASHNILRAHLEKGTRIYGVNTGFGKLSQVQISEKDQKQLQTNLVHSHVAGVGEPFSDGIVRTAMLLKLQTFSKGASGVRAEVADQILHFLNHDILPIVPSRGSVGASGDLAPLAQIALAFLGQGNVRLQGKIISAGEALSMTGGKPLELGPKEGLSLINGTQISTALGLMVLCEAQRLLNQADIIGAISVEASLSSRNIFSPDIHQLKAHPGQQESARIIFALLKNSEIVASHSGCNRTQDPYSYRCIPQVHGASRDMIDHAGTLILREANSVSDNPVILPNGSIRSSGHFHGEAVAQALDAMSIALSEIGAMSERRIHYFMKGIDDKIPPFIAIKPGLESGLMLAHVTATALASENKTLAHPASVDSISSSAGQEDIVSMAPWAGHKAHTIAVNVRRILAIELLTGFRAIDLFQNDLKPGDGTGPVIQYLIKHLQLPASEFSPGPVITQIETILEDSTLETLSSLSLENRCEKSPAF